MANGNAAKLQLGVESTYATEATPEVQIRFTSEGFKYSPTKAEEGLLTGGKATGRSYTMGKKAEGSISTNVRPDEAGFWLGLGLGKEEDVELVSGSTGAHKHTFVAIGNALNDSLPSATVLVDRIVDIFAYPGCKISDFSFSAAPGDYLKIDANFQGKDEIADKALGTLTPSSLKPFRFQHGKVKLDDEIIADVTSINFSYNNNVEADLQTTSSGVFYKEPEAGARNCTMELEVLYTEETEALRQSYLKNDEDLSVELVFTSEEEIEEDVPYSLTISVPHAQLDNAEANISGAERIRQNISLIAIEEAPDEFITVELVNGRATKYI